MNANDLDRLGIFFLARVGQPTGPHGCTPWLGSKNTKGYGVLFFTLENGRKTKLRAHRVAYMINKQILLIETKIHGKQYDISHVCHQADCVNIDHLIFESHETNCERYTCKLQGACMQCHVPKCLLWYVKIKIKCF